MSFFHHISREEFEELQAKAERGQMENEARVHEIEDWVDNLDAHETFLLAQLLIALFGNKTAQASQVGCLHGKLKYKYGVDPRTGEPFGADVLKDAT